MKRVLVTLTMAFALCFAMLPTGANAGAYATPFSVAITYQNVGTGPATINFSFFAENSGTAITIPGAALAAGASTSLNVGTAITSGSFKGSAVLSSDQPVIATIVQFNTGIRNRLLSNGFGSADGASSVLIATVLKNQFDNTTVFSVQNTESAAVNVKVEYFATGATTPTHTETANNLPAGAAKYFDSGAIGGLPNGFNGSARVTATLSSDGTTAAKVVATVNELQVSGSAGSSFEGAPQSGNKVFMPSALCNFAGVFNTAYAVQNADASNPVSFQVRYKVTGGSDVVDGPFNVPAGGKQSVQGCAKMPQGSTGSAIIERTSAAGSLVAVGKVFGGNISSAFIGVIEGQGSAKVAVPYVRWSPDSTYNNGSRQRANIAIQNIGGTDATNVKVQYIDRDGVVKGTHTLGTIAAGAKISSSPALGSALDSCGRFGEYGGGANCLGDQFGGGAIITADSGAQLAVVVRISTGNPTLAGEDYTGVNVQ